MPSSEEKIVGSLSPGVVVLVILLHNGGGSSSVEASND